MVERSRLVSLVTSGFPCIAFLRVARWKTIGRCLKSGNAIDNSMLTFKHYRYFEHSPREYGSFGSRPRRSAGRKPLAESEKDEWNRQREDEIFGSLLDTFSPPSALPQSNQPQPGALVRKSSSGSMNSGRKPIPFSQSQQQDRDALPFTLSQQGSQPASDTTQSTTIPSVPKEPTEVILRGFPTDSQWRALEFFDSAAGTILEDYVREPPGKLYSFGTGISGPGRPLTRAEKEKVNVYRGGEHWIKVTFESRAQAEQAIELSPREVDNFWVIAELYRGLQIAPEEDSVYFISKWPEGPPLRRQNSASQEDAIAAPTTVAPSPPPTSYLKAIRTINRFTADPTGSIRGHTTQSEMSPERAVQARRRREMLQAKQPIVLPDEQLYLPQPSQWSVYWRSSWLGKMVQGHDLYNGDAPIQQDNTFDWASATMYWRACMYLDLWIPWCNILGLKAGR